MNIVVCEVMEQNSEFYKRIRARRLEGKFEGVKMPWRDGLSDGDNAIELAKRIYPGCTMYVPHYDSGGNILVECHHPYVRVPNPGMYTDQQEREAKKCYKDLHRAEWHESIAAVRYREARAAVTVFRSPERVEACRKDWERKREILEATLKVWLKKHLDVAYNCNFSGFCFHPEMDLK